MEVRGNAVSQKEGRESVMCAAEQLWGGQMHVSSTAKDNPPGDTTDTA